MLHSAVSYKLLRLCDCTRSRLDTQTSNLGAYTPGARCPQCFGATEPRCIGASPPSVLGRSLHQYPRCFCDSEPRFLGLLGASESRCFSASEPRCFSAFGAPEPRRPRCSNIPYINTVGASVPQNLIALPSLVPQRLDASVLKCSLHRYPQCFSAPESRCFGAQHSLHQYPRCFGASEPCRPRCFSAFGASEPRHPRCSNTPCISILKASVLSDLSESVLRHP
ncbi:UNVERIFIED_CONTAM: hypothetical protein FKN15_058190 [Acipenser sinensis]